MAGGQAGHWRAGPHLVQRRLRLLGEAEGISGGRRAQTWQGEGRTCQDSQAIPSPSPLPPSPLPDTCPGQGSPSSAALEVPTREKGIASLGGWSRCDQGVQVDQGGGGGAKEGLGGFTVLPLLARFRQGVSQIGKVKALCPILPGAGEQVAKGVGLWDGRRGDET